MLEYSTSCLAVAQSLGGYYYCKFEGFKETVKKHLRLDLIKCWEIFKVIVIIILSSL